MKDKINEIIKLFGNGIHKRKGRSSYKYELYVLSLLDIFRQASTIELIDYYTNDKSKGGVVKHRLLAEELKRRDPDGKLYDIFKNCFVISNGLKK